jgi:hypothetical protein
MKLGRGTNVPTQLRERRGNPKLKEKILAYISYFERPKVWVEIG